MPLTDIAVKKAKPSEKAIKLFDDRGLYLLISPSGCKWWRLKYRFDGKEKKIALGVYPDVSLKDARDRRDEARKLLANGIDPSENRKAQRAARADNAGNSLEVIAREWFAKYSEIWVVSHRTPIIRLFERDAHIVPLSRQAIEILRELHPITGRGRFVFPSAVSNARAMSDNAILAAMRRMGIAKEEMSGHGFRAVARTILDEVLGVRPDFIEHQLAHAVRDPNGRAYNRTAHLPARKEMMQLWADYLDELKAKTDGISIRQ
jgi:hypothetical protein